MCQVEMEDVSIKIQSLWKCEFSMYSFVVFFFTELKCLQIILADESKALEEDCKNKLEKRIEMFRNAAVSKIFIFTALN